MPKYRIKGPDGKTYQVEGPEGATREQIIDYIQKNQVSAKPPEPDKPILDRVQDFVSGTSNAAANAMTFGLAEKARGAIGAARNEIFDVFGWDTGQTAQEAYNQPRTDRVKFQQSNPWAAGISGAVGGMANPAGQAVGKWMAGMPINQARAITQPIAKAAGTGKYVRTLGTPVAANINQGLGQAIGRGMAGGAGMGAAYSGVDVIDQPMSLADKLKQTATGAGIGAAFGGAIPPLLKGGAKIGTLVKDTAQKMTPFRQTDIGARKVVEALQRDGWTLPAAIARVKELGPEGALMDLGDNAGQAAWAAKATAGPGKKIITDKLVKRQLGFDDADMNMIGGQGRRVSKMIDELIPEARVGKNADKIRALYKQAYKENKFIENSDIDSFLKNTPNGKAAFKKAIEKMRNSRQTVSQTDPELTALLDEAIADGMSYVKTGVGVGRGLKLQTLDYVKRALGDAEKMAIRQGAADDARIIGDQRRFLTKALDNADATAKAGPNSLKIGGGAYARARKLAGDDFKHDDAFELGMNFMTGGKKGSVKALAEDIKDMSETQLHELRQGAAEALKGKLDNLNVWQDVTRHTAGSHRLEDKIKLVFGNKEMFKKYKIGIRNEEAMHRTYNKVMGNSSTAERQAVLEDAGLDPARIAQALQDMSSGSPTGMLRAVGSLLTGGKQKILGPSKETAKSMAEMLIGNGMDPRLVQYWMKNPTPGQFPKLTDALLRGSLPKATTPDDYKMTLRKGTR